VIGNLTLDQLRILVTVAETGSFSAAGRRLNRAQSAMSQAIATLEKVQGVTLFDRSGHRPVLTDVGKVLVAQARNVLSGAAQFETLAAGTRENIEPELTVVIDPLVPTDTLIDSIQALSTRFPDLPVTFSSEGLRGGERRIRRGEAALAFCALLPVVPEDINAHPLLEVDMITVVAPNHPLARLRRPASRADLQEHVQLVLSDPFDPGGPSYGVLSSRVWRFVELTRRVDFLLAGLGWCRMPSRLVTAHVAQNRLVVLEIEDRARSSDPVTIYAAHMHDRPLGRAGTWLLDHLRGRGDGEDCRESPILRRP
jgi:DNA-binding transcriptional LysR family regulator